MPFLPPIGLENTYIRPSQSNKDMKTLVVVDLQKDFYHPDGSLYVSGAETLPERIADIIPGFDTVIFSLDWHPYDHCSFVEQGGIWPVHCVQYSEGASLPLSILDAAADKKVLYYRKGKNRKKEEYAAFNTVPKEIGKAFAESSTITIAGLCGDYCVGETVKNLLKMGYGDKLRIGLGYIGSIDGGKALDTIIKEYNLKTTL